MSDQIKVEGGGGGWIALVIILIWFYSAGDKLERIVDAYECQVYGPHEKCEELEQIK